MRWRTEAGPVYPDLPKSDLEQSALYSMPGVLYVVFDRNGEWLVSVDSPEALAALPTRMPSGYLVRGLVIPPSDLDPRTAHKFWRPSPSRQGNGMAQIGTLGLNLHIGPVARVSTIMRADSEPDMRTNNLDEAARKLRSAMEEDHNWVMDQPNDTVTVRKIEEALNGLRSSISEGHVSKGSLNEAIQIFLHSIVSRIASRVPESLKADKMQVAPAGVGEPYVAAEGYTKGDLAIEWYCVTMEQFNTSPPSVLALLNYKDAMMKSSTDVRFEVSILEPAERLVDQVVKHLSEL